MLLDKIQSDMTIAMRAKQTMILDTLRSIKTALERYRTDQQKPVTEQVEQSILKTLAKQRREAADAFRKGGREESAAKEEAELLIIEAYMLRPASEEEMDAAVAAAMQEARHAHSQSTGQSLSMKQMGGVIKIATGKLSGKTVDGRRLSEKVKAALGAP